MTEVKPLKITETVLRDGPQSLVATRMRVQDMIPVLVSVIMPLKPGAALPLMPACVFWTKIPGDACAFYGTVCRKHQSRCCCADKIY